MKQQSIFKCLMIICIGFFISCSNNDDASSGQLVLIKKVTENIYISGGDVETSISDFIYQNNALKKITNGTNYTEFVYSDNKITVSKSYENNILDKTNTYVYTGDLLTSVESDGNYPAKTDFAYTNQKLSAVVYKFLDNGNWIMNGREFIQFNAELNVNQNIVWKDYGFMILEYKELYTYDTGNNPMRDMNPYLRLYFGCEGFDGKSANNAVSRQVFSPPTSTISDDYDYVTTYNSTNFPVEIKKYSSNGSLISQTVIEYQ